MALANLIFIIHGKRLNLHITTINLKSLLQLVMMNLIYLMNYILFQTFKFILNIYTNYNNCLGHMLIT